MAIQRSLTLEKVRCLLVMDKVYQEPSKDELDYDEIYDSNFGTQLIFPGWEDIQIPDDVLAPENKIVWPSFGSGELPYSPTDPVGAGGTDV